MTDLVSEIPLTFIASVAQDLSSKYRKRKFEKFVLAAELDEAFLNKLQSSDAYMDILSEVVESVIRSRSQLSIICLGLAFREFFDDPEKIMRSVIAFEGISEKNLVFFHTSYKVLKPMTAQGDADPYPCAVVDTHLSTITDLIEIDGELYLTSPVFSIQDAQGITNDCINRGLYLPDHANMRFGSSAIIGFDYYSDTFFKIVDKAIEITKNIISDFLINP